MASFTIPCCSNRRKLASVSHWERELSIFAKQVTGEMSVMAAIGIAAGLAVGFTTVHFIASLLYDVKSTDPSMTFIPILVIAGTAVVAALPAVIRAVRIDPASMLRVD